MSSRSLGRRLATARRGAGLLLAASIVGLATGLYDFGSSRSVCILGVEPTSQPNAPMVRLATGPAGATVPEPAGVARAAHRAPDGEPPPAPLPPAALGGLERARSGDAASDGSGLSVALTLDDLEQIAQESNPTLVQASMAVQAAQGNYVQAGLYPNPVIGYIGDEIGGDGGQGFQGGGVAQEIVTAGKLRLGRAVASHEVEQARLVWETQRRRVLNDVRAGYYDVLVAQKMIEVNEQLVRIGEEGVKATEKLRAAQEVSRTDVLQAQIEAESASLNLVEARNFLSSAWRRLIAVLGRPEMDLTPLVGEVEKDLPLLEWKSTLDQLWAQSPELAQARAGVERAQCELARQYAMRVPNLGVGAVVKYDTVSRYTVADVEFGLPLPLFDRNQGRILRAQADLAAARNELRRVELSLYDRLASAFEQYATARQRVETYTKTILPHAQKSLDLIGIGYREGEFGYLNLLTAQRTYFGVSLDHLRNLREFRARCVELEGMLLRGGLEAVERPEPSVD